MMQTASALEILLVDDDRPLLDMLTRSFEREGHHVTAVTDGQSALEAAAGKPYDIVLLDVALGAGPTGHDVARLLQGRRERTWSTASGVGSTLAPWSISLRVRVCPMRRGAAPTGRASGGWRPARRCWRR